MSSLTLTTIVVITIVIAGFILPLRLSWRSKAVMCLVALLAPSKGYIYPIVGGTVWDPEIPYNLSFVFDIARATMMFLTILVLLRLVINGFYKLVTFTWSNTLLPTFSLFHAQLMLIVSFALACYGTSCAYGMPELKQYSVTMERLDPRLDGMRVVMMSDIHISSPTDVNLIYAMVNKVNALNPDLILLPGDLIDGPVELRRPITNLLFDLKAKYGTFISTGNHEYYSDYQAWRSYFEQGGLISLDNKVVMLQDAQGKNLLNLGGITDPRAERYNLPTPDIKGVTAALDESVPNIILSHRPQYAHDLAAADKKVDLVLSGHTHGGLIIGLDKIVANANGGFASGRYQVQDTTLIVGNGTMLWMGFPLRLGVPSQIVEITLHSKQKPAKDAVLLTADYDLKQQQIAKAEAQKAAAAAKKAQAELKAVQAQEDANADEAAEDAAKLQAQATAAAKAQVKANQTEPPAMGEGLGAISDVQRPKSENAVQGLQLILPMVDTESGAITESVTRVALLPEGLTQDQLERINAIIKEDPEAMAKAKAEEALRKAQEATLEAQSSPTHGVRMVVVKDSTTMQEQEQAQTKAQAQAQAQTQTSTPGTLHLMPAAPAETAPAASDAAAAAGAGAGAGAESDTATSEDKKGAEENVEQSAITLRPEDHVLRFEGDDTDTTLELQAEYAISLGNNSHELDDSTVSDLLTTPPKEK